MDIQGRLVSTELVNCSVPLTMIIRGKKVVIGRATVEADGFVRAKVDNGEARQMFSASRFMSQLSVRMNPEVRLEPRPARMLGSLEISKRADEERSAYLAREYIDADEDKRRLVSMLIEIDSAREQIIRRIEGQGVIYLKAN